MLSMPASAAPQTSLEEQIAVERYFIAQGALVPPAFGFYWLGLHVPTQLPSGWPLFQWVVQLPAASRCAGAMPLPSARCPAVPR
jgi:hypothetical protein